MRRAEEAALKAYPVHSVLILPARRGGYYADNHLREGFIKGYEQAEKDTIERAIKWIEAVDDNEYTNCDIEGNSWICARFIKDFRKAMEEE